MGGSELSAHHLDSSRRSRGGSPVAVGRLRASRATQGSGSLHRGKATNAVHKVARETGMQREAILTFCWQHRC